PRAAFASRLVVSSPSPCASTRGRAALWKACAATPRAREFVSAVSREKARPRCLRLLCSGSYVALEGRLLFASLSRHPKPWTDHLAKDSLNYALCLRSSSGPVYKHIFLGALEVVQQHVASWCLVFPRLCARIWCRPVGMWARQPNC